MNEDRCVCCGEIIPEGRWACPNCQAKNDQDKLSMEVSMALASGMSYGKWKAMQTPVKIEPRKDPLTDIHYCACCGREFISKDNRRRKYCSVKCRKTATLKNARKKYLLKVSKL